MIKIYTIDNCPWCTKVKKYLKQQGVDFIEFNIEHDENLQKECINISGDTTVPVVTDGTNVSVGFKKSILDTIIANQ